MQRLVSHDLIVEIIWDCEIQAFRHQEGAALIRTHVAPICTDLHVFALIRANSHMVNARLFLLQSESVLRSARPINHRMDLPDLSGVIKPSDIKQKGKGSYAADYMSWAKTMYYLRKHAPSWLPHVSTADDNGHVFRAPNDTGYLLISFVHPSHGETTQWIYAITSNQNTPIPYSKISSADIANSARRGICSAAAAFFLLGFELWAREEVTEQAPEPLGVPNTSKPQAVPQTPATNAAEPAEILSHEDLMDKVCNVLDKIAVADRKTYLELKQKQWNLNAGGSRVAQMSYEQLQECLNDLDR